MSTLSEREIESLREQLRLLDATAGELDATKDFLTREEYIERLELHIKLLTLTNRMQIMGRLVENNVVGMDEIMPVIRDSAAAFSELSAWQKAHPKPTHTEVPNE